MRGAASFAPPQRLRRGADFRRILEKGVRVGGPLFVMVGLFNACGLDRLGLTVSRRVGVAVARNRARRLLREAFRRHRAPEKERRGLDLVVLAGRALAESAQGEVDREFADRLRRLERRIAERGGPRAPAADRGL